MKKKYAAPEFELIRLTLGDAILGSEQSIPVDLGDATGDGTGNNDDLFGGV